MSLSDSLHKSKCFVVECIERSRVCSGWVSKTSSLVILNFLLLLSCLAALVSRSSSGASDLQTQSLLGMFSSSSAGFFPPPHCSASSLLLLQDFRPYLLIILLCRKPFPLPLPPFLSFWPSSSSRCVGCSQAWRQRCWWGDVVQQLHSSQQWWRQHEEFGARREHQPEEQHQRELGGAARGRASLTFLTRPHPTSGAPCRGLHLLPQWVDDQEQIKKCFRKQPSVESQEELDI